MKIAIIGLGKMGSQFVAKLIKDSHQVVVYDNQPTQIDAAAKLGAIVASSREDVVSKFDDSPPVIWLMIPFSAVEAEMKAWQQLLPSGAILVDGGNSKYEQTIVMAKLLADSGISLVDVGTSGGVLGNETGFSFMIGGDETAVDTLDPIFKSLSSPSGAYNYFGPSGTGHYIKMIHNAIEYGVMESLAEGYHLLADSPFENLNLAAIAEVWQHGSIVESRLNGLTRDIFKENPKLSGVEGVVEEKGEARWALEEGLKRHVEMPAVSASLEVRAKSRSGDISFATKLLAALRTKFGGHLTNPK